MRINKKIIEEKNEKIKISSKYLKEYSFYSFNWMTFREKKNEKNHSNLILNEK